MAELQSWERLHDGDTGDVILAADRWATEIHTTEPRVRALLGFCAGSMSGAAQLESVSRSEDTPAHLIVLGPEESVVDGIHHDILRDDSVAQTIRSILIGTATTACQPGQCCEQGDS